MAIATVAQKNTLATAYAAAATHGAVYTSAPGSTAGSEPSGGSPAYARKALSWGTAAGGVVSTAGTVFDIPAGTTIVGAGLHAGASGAYLDGGPVTSQSFASQGTYTITFTYTQS